MPPQFCLGPQMSQHDDVTGLSGSTVSQETRKQSAHKCVRRIKVRRQHEIMPISVSIAPDKPVIYLAKTVSHLRLGKLRL